MHKIHYVTGRRKSGRPRKKGEKAEGKTFPIWAPRSANGGTTHVGHNVQDLGAVSKCLTCFETLYDVKGDDVKGAVP